MDEPGTRGLWSPGHPGASHPRTLQAPCRSSEIPRDQASSGKSGQGRRASGLVAGFSKPTLPPSPPSPSSPSPAIRICTSPFHLPTFIKGDKRFYLDYQCKDPVPKSSHILRLWGSGLQHGGAAGDERQITPRAAESLDLLPGPCLAPNLAWRVPLLNSQQAGLSSFPRQMARLWVRSRVRWSTVGNGRRCPEGLITQHSGFWAKQPLPHPARPLLGAWPCGPLTSPCKVGINYSHFTEEETETQGRESPGPGTEALDTSPGQDSVASWTMTRTASPALGGRPPPPKLCLVTVQ